METPTGLDPVYTELQSVAIDLITAPWSSVTGAPGGIRTPNPPGLSRSPLPIGIPRRGGAKYAAGPEPFTYLAPLTWLESNQHLVD